MILEGLCKKHCQGLSKKHCQGTAQKHCQERPKSIVMLNLFQHLHYIQVYRFRNRFGMTLRNELLVIPVSGEKCRVKTSDGNREYHLPTVSRRGVPVF